MEIIEKIMHLIGYTILMLLAIAHSPEIVHVIGYWFLWIGAALHLTQQ